MKIFKFGGTSVGTPENIKQLIKIVLDAKKEEDVAVIVSAFSGVTDKFIELGELASNSRDYITPLEDIKKRHYDAINELILDDKGEVVEKVDEIFADLESILAEISEKGEYPDKSVDAVMSFGERFSAFIISRAFKDRGVYSEYLDARKVIRTNDYFRAAGVDFEITNKQIKDYFDKHKDLQVITGFIGSTEDGQTTTLGRGGSDYSASIFGATLGAKVIEIWTDVDGVFTTDPRKVKSAFPVDKMTYKEAMEMSHFGAKVIHPPTMQPALKKNIPILIKNTFNPSAPGTVIGNEPSSKKLPATGISSIDNISLLSVTGAGMVGVAGVSSRLFGVLAENRISVILISQASSEHSICFAVVPEAAEKAKKVIEEEFAKEVVQGSFDEVEIQSELSIVALVGENMKKTSGIAGKLFKAFGDSKINVVAIAQGSSELNISVVISRDDEKKALEVIHKAFFESGCKPLNIFLIGTGLIGGTLLAQVFASKKKLLQEDGLELNIKGIADIDKMVLDPSQDWKKDLENGQNSDLKKFVEEVKTAQLPNKVLVDCTATDITTPIYKEVLKAGVSVVTPNKKANSADYQTYKELQDLSKNGLVKFLYETNVGAALPVVSVLQDLVKTGDEIVKIEGVLSGTLSYIFNNFEEGKKFSEVVKQAKENGYTEPDPRDDLNGMDVMRKILILARESGLKLEPEDVEVENLISASARSVDSVDDFFVALEKEDLVWDEKLKEAMDQGKVLRYIAKLENGKTEVSLQAVRQDHPFYSLSGTDNIVSFTTKRYNNTPLVIKGPGAGAEVTAAGVFADILRVVS